MSPKEQINSTISVHSDGFDISVVIIMIFLSY